MTKGEEYSIIFEEGYQKGRADADQFLKQWKEDVMNSLCKYDANSVEEVYNYGINKGRADVLNEIIKGLKALKDRNFDTYYIDDEIKWLEQLKGEY